MHNNLRFSQYVQVFFSCCLIASCSHLKTIEQIQPISNVGLVNLELKPLVGRKEKINYYSHSKVKTFENQQLVREKDEIVEFQVESEILSYENNLIRTLVSTVIKDGLVDLHDLAFPELNERIEFIYKPNAEVLYAGGYPSSSVFYVPPLSLPDSEVAVGDTWEMQRSWVSMRNNIPLNIQLVSILKNIYPCGQNEKCADLEISGDVSIIVALNKDVQFNSQITGRIIFSIDKGSILWSMVRSAEVLTLAETRMEVLSCLVSQLTEPRSDQWVTDASDLRCNPQEIDTIVIPRL